VDDERETPQFTPNPRKRSQILESARRVFFIDGFGAATIDKIASDSTVSKATIYKYFDGKHEMFAAIMREGTDGSLLIPRFDWDAQTPAETLTRIGVGILHRMLDPASMQMFRLMVAESARFPELGATFEKEGPRRGQKLIEQYLAKLDANGILEIDNAALAAGQFVGLCQAGIFMRAQLSKYSPSEREIERVVASAVRVFLRGYAPE
jgi:TetR/AcrR family transcriptional repressor of mexJK operon